MKQVAITGIGLHIPGAQFADNLFGQLFAAKSYITFDKRLTELGVNGVASCAATDDDIATLDALYPDVASQLSRGGKMAYHAFQESLYNAGLDMYDKTQRRGLFLGVNKVLVSPKQLFSMWQHYDGSNCFPGNSEEDSSGSQKMLPEHTAAVVMAKSIDLSSDVFAFSDACAAGSISILSGFRRVRSGELDIAICGGCDEGTQPIMQLMFKKIGALTLNNGGYESPAQICRPFDKDRSGCVLADGAAFMVLEELEIAQSRNANILAVISGVARSSESYKMTSSHPDGRFYKACMEMALEDAGLQASSINHINAHGTATKSNDIAEGNAINTLFGSGIPVTSTKSALGHSLAGSGAVEAVLSVLSIKNQKLLPTLNYISGSDDEAELNIVTQGRSHCIDHILSNSFGFGGQNSSLIISREGLC